MSEYLLLEVRVHEVDVNGTLERSRYFSDNFQKGCEQVHGAVAGIRDSQLARLGVVHEGRLPQHEAVLVVVPSDYGVEFYYGDKHLDQVSE